MLKKGIRYEIGKSLFIGASLAFVDFGSQILFGKGKPRVYEEEEKNVRFNRNEIVKKIGIKESEKEEGRLDFNSLCRSFASGILYNMFLHSSANAFFMKEIIPLSPFFKKCVESTMFYIFSIGWRGKEEGKLENEINFLVFSSAIFTLAEMSVKKGSLKILAGLRLGFFFMILNMYENRFPMFN